MPLGTDRREARRCLWRESFDDSLTDALRNGASAMLAQAVEVEFADFHSNHADLTTEAGLPASFATVICPSVE